jgi:hypothetical protein
MREHTQSLAIQAETTVNIDIAQARRWFLELETYPERYQFKTHAGFAFDEGQFGQVGARFHTRERFYGLRLTLHFEVVESHDEVFRFHLVRPPLPVWGAFVIEAADDGITNLCLEVGGTTRLGLWFLRLPLVKGAIQRQIRGEVRHIKASMEKIAT